MIYHLCIYFPSTLAQVPHVRKIILSGNCGVDIFLFMSGISLYRSFGKYTTKDFLFRRYYRILPIYFTVCLGYYILQFIVISTDFNAFICSLFFININTHGECFWYILCILVCYSLYPFIIKLLKNTSGGMVFILGIIALTFIHPEVLHSFFLKYEIIITRLPIFIIGCYLGLICENGCVYNIGTSEKYLPQNVCTRQFIVSLQFLSVISLMTIAYVLCSNYIMSMIGTEYLRQIFYRYRLSFFGLTAIALILTVLKGTRYHTTHTVNLLSAMTLEIYVFHVCIKNLTAVYICSDNALSLTVYIFIVTLLTLLFSCVYKEFIRRFDKKWLLKH